MSGTDRRERRDGVDSARAGALPRPASWQRPGEPDKPAEPTKGRIARQDLAEAMTRGSMDSSEPPLRHALLRVGADSVTVDSLPIATPQIDSQQRGGALDETIDGGSRPAMGEGGALYPGAWIGRYTILAKLGEGGMGEVFSAYDTELERRVAIKILRPRVVHDPLGQVRMQREAQALARLSHPNVVQIHDVGALGGQLFVAMEFVKGPTLRAWQEARDPRGEAGRAPILAMYAQAGAGLAAAHARGLVHRDFKPDNVLVGDDGRARVLDFGLAAGLRELPATGEASERSKARAVGLLDSDLTRTGSIMGTPAYMAPEQFLAQAADARADIFAFAAALYEALYGELPFAGDTFAERHAAVVDGVVRPAPEGASVPAWLRCVLLRGLARDPADRYGDIETFLADLLDDPIARRRRRARIFAALVGVLVLIAGLIFGGLSLAQRWGQARAEAMAEERRLAVEERIDELQAGGAEEEADRAFQAFVTNPDNRGSAALARAWLGHGERARTRDAMVDALDAYASAYTVATETTEQVAALVGLAELARDELRWRALVFAVETLARRFPEHMDHPATRDLSFNAALARGDFEAAEALLSGPGPSPYSPSVRTVVRSLRGAQRSDYTCCSAGSSVVEGEHGEQILVLNCCGESRSYPGGAPDAPPKSPGGKRRGADIRRMLVRVDPELSLLGPVESPNAYTRALSVGPQGSGLILQGGDPSIESQDRKATMYGLDGATMVPLFEWPEETVTAALSADIDGDGERDYFVGSGPYTRHVRELVASPGEEWSMRASAPALDRRRSDIVDLLAGDLDDDGQVEVVAALGPWIAYELQVLRRDQESQELRTITRHRLGNIVGAALARPGAGEPPEVVVVKSDENPNTKLFPADKPLGDPAGVYFFRFREEALEETARLPAPPSREQVRFLDTPPLVGDLDGDGDDEVILSRRRGQTNGGPASPILVILVRGEDGDWTSLHLNEVWPIAVIDVDGDGDSELLVAPEDTRDLWILGMGDSQLPDLRPSDARFSEGTPADPALAEMWRHAGDLAQMGLPRQAADNFATIADLALTSVDRARAQVIAGREYESVPDDAAAAPLYAEAAASGHVEAGIAAVRSFLRVGIVDRAADELRRLQGAMPDSPVDDAQLDPLIEAVSELTGEPGLDIRFDRALDPFWRVRQPLALDRGPERLRVDAINTGEIMSAPLRWTGSALSLEVELDINRSEWMGGLDIIVEPVAGGPIPLRIELTHSGGGSIRRDEIACQSYERRVNWVRPFQAAQRDAAHLRRFHVRVTLIPQLQEWTFEVTDGDGEVLALYRFDYIVVPARSEEYRLVIAGSRNTQTWVQADLRRLSLTGAALGRPTPSDSGPGEDPVERAGRRLVEHDPLGALEELGELASPSPTSRLLSVVAHARLGRWAQAQAELTELLSDRASANTVMNSLGALLRTDPAVYGPLVRGAGGQRRFHELLCEAWSLAFEMELDDPRTLTTLWDGLIDLDLEEGSFTLLKIRGFVARRLGHRNAAEASFLAALAALDNPARKGELTYESREYELASIIFERAASAVENDDIERAKTLLRPLLEGDDPDPYVIDRLRARADLRQVWGLAEGL